MKGGGGTARGSVPGAGLSRLIRASTDWVLCERRGGILPAPHQGTTLVRGARVLESKCSAGPSDNHTLPTTVQLTVS